MVALHLGLRKSEPCLLELLPPARNLRNVCVVRWNR